MSTGQARSFALSAPRRFIADLLHASQRVPTVAMERRMDLRPVVVARAARAVRPGWCSIFTKAYALVAARRPMLRRAYLAFPYERLYEHPVNVANLALDRWFGTERGVGFILLEKPEEM